LARPIYLTALWNSSFLQLFANTAPLVVEFLSRARSYGEGDATAQNYVSFMKDVMGFQNMYSMVPDIVRLLKVRQEGRKEGRKEEGGSEYGGR
jgi:hypothetical protein